MQSTEANILIGYNLRGHHYDYTLEFIKSFIHESKVFLLIFFDESSKDDYLILESKFNNKLELIYIHKSPFENFLSRLGGIFENISNWLAIRRTYYSFNSSAEIHALKIIYLFFDSIDYSVGLFNFPIRLNQEKTSCLTIQNKLLTKNSKIFCPQIILKKAIIKKAYSFNQIKYFSIDPTIAKDIPKIKVLADPINKLEVCLKNEAKDFLKLLPNTFLITLVGAISSRKGLDEFLMLAQYFNKISSDIIFLIAGKQDEQSKMAIKNSGLNNLKVLDCYISHKDLGIIISATDIMWVAYKNHLTVSGILSTSLIYQIPCVVPSNGLIHDIASSGLDEFYAIDMHDFKNHISNLIEFIHEKKSAFICRENFAIPEMQKKHSWNNFNSSFNK